MSYREEGDLVILTMSREDYAELLTFINAFTFFVFGRKEIRNWCDRLNQGNPNYTPYQVEEKKC